MTATAAEGIWGIGNAIVDLQVRTEDAFLQTLGVTKGQTMLVDPGRQRLVLAALEGQPIHKSSGGSVANTIVGIADLGGSAGFCGRVARDHWGDFFVQDLERMGIRVDCGFGLQATGTSVVLITPDAQRTMLTSLGAAAEIGPEDVKPESMEGARYAYVEGYLFAGDRSRAAALRAIEVAKDRGVKVALTVSDPFVIEMCRDLFWELIEGPVDLLFCNEQEARALTERDDPMECAREIHRHAENVALTLGRRGSILMHEDEAYPVEGVSVEELDTTGAGDMYAAGILYGITHGLSWPAAGHLASHAAARVVSQLGARLTERFTEEEIQALSRRS